MNDFGRLVAPYVAELTTHCRRILGDSEDAKDAVQETLLRAWLRLDELRDERLLRSWLYTIATNTSLNLLRSRRRTPAPSEEAEAETAGVDDAYERRESVERAFATAIRALPPRQRAVLILRDALALSAAEVAELLGTPIASVNSALQRARASVALAGGADGPLGDLEDALLSSYVSAWESTDVFRLLAVARADAVRVALIERLNPRSGGWVHLPSDDWGEATFRPAFAVDILAEWQESRPRHRLP